MTPREPCHRWEPAGHREQTCALCGAWCQRDHAGKILLFSTDAAAKLWGRS